MLTRRPITEHGGVERVVSDVTDELKRQRPEWEVAAVAAFGKAGWIEGLDGASDVLASIRLGWRLARTPHDVAFVHCPECVWGMRVLRFLGPRRPLVVVWHGAGPQPYLVLREPGDLLARGLAWFRCLEERRALKAQAHVAVHPVIEQDLRSVYGFRGPIQVIENAVGKETLARLTAVGPPSNEGPMVALWAGQAGHRKGLDVALAALALARHTVPKMRLLVVGLPAGEPLPGVDWLGVVPPEAMPEVYAQAHVLLFPTRYESFGLVVIESMAAGLAVVISDAVPVGVATSGRNGFVIPGHDPGLYSEALVLLARDPSARERISRANRTDAMRFSVETAGGRYAALVDKLSNSPT